jgi:hypothetical protein
MDLRFAAHAKCFANGYTPNDELFEELFREVFIRLIYIGATYVVDNDDWTSIYCKGDDL